MPNRTAEECYALLRKLTITDALNGRVTTIDERVVDFANTIRKEAILEAIDEAKKVRWDGDKDDDEMKLMILERLTGGNNAK